MGKEVDQICQPRPVTGQSAAEFCRQYGFADRTGVLTPAQHLARMTEIRVGELLPPPRQGQRTDLEPYSHESEVTRNDRQRFRLLAAYRSLIEPMLPASRRKLLKAVAEQQEAERNEVLAK
jgi:hypothetical protein